MALKKKEVFVIFAWRPSTVGVRASKHVLSKHVLMLHLHMATFSPFCYDSSNRDERDRPQK